MKCANCDKEFYSNGKLLNVDGDFACNSICEKEYIKERDYFMNVVIHDDKLMDKWWRNSKSEE